jgi:hypothetical protein
LTWWIMVQMDRMDEPIVGMLSLGREGADRLIGAIFDRQIATE